MLPIRLDVLGIVDIVAGILMLYTTSPVPMSIAEVHAWFLIFKGAIFMFRYTPRLPIPFFYLGGIADLISALILFTGTPPVLVGYKNWLAALLGIKGLWSLIGLTH